MEKTKRLSRFEVIAYALTTATGLGNMLCMTYLSSFWTDVLGISAATVGTILLLSRIFDGFTDIIMGNIIDNTNSKHGKAKPWLFVGSIGIFVTSIVLFSVPNSMGMTQKVVISFIVYTIMSVIFATMSGIACAALNNLITTDINDRVRLGSLYFVFYFALTILLSFGIVLIDPLGGGQGAWIKLCIIVGIISLICVTISWKGITERVHHKAEKKKEGNFKEIIYEMTHNKYFFYTMGIYMCINIYNAMVLGVGVYYALYIMKDVKAFTILTIASYAPCLLGTAVTPTFVQKFGLGRVVFIGNALTIAGYALIAVNPRNIIWASIFIAIGGFGSGAISANINPFCAMAADYGEYKLGKAMPGVYSGACSFGTKVGSALGGAAYGFILAAAGYNGLAETQTTSAQAAIIGCYALAPAILTVAILLLSIPFTKLEKEYPHIIDELTKRRESKEVEG